MTKPKGLTDKYFRLLILGIVCFGIIYLVARHINTSGNVLLVLLGFGTVILVHEFGHFTVAKLSGIKVEAFSIFMPPILFGLQRTENGFRVRILPEVFPKEGGEHSEGALSFTLGRKGIPSDTEYRIGLIPFGGFVKMLGQEDVGQIKSTDDPRSFANKPALVRAGVLAAGVFFNIISAGIIFMIAFLIGIELPPPVVGDVIPNSPAAHAGLRAGDEIIEINGKTKNLDFSDISVAAALSGRNEEVPMKVKHMDGSEEELKLTAEELPGEKLKGFGIIQPQTLTIANLPKDEEKILFEKTGLKSGDKVIAVGGKEVQSNWEFMQVIRNTFAPKVTLTVERKDADSGGYKRIETQIPLTLDLTGSGSISESGFGDVYSMIPRLKIADVLTQQDSNSVGPALKPGDVVLMIDDVENPVYKQMREVATEYENKELPIKVLRTDDNGADQVITVNVVPKRQPGGDKVMIGVALEYDLGHAVIAGTVKAEDDKKSLNIPSGSTITAVDGVNVSNFYDIAREINKYAGQRITIDYRLNEQVAGAVPMDVGDDEGDYIIKSNFIGIVPFESLKRIYKADGPVDALLMGYRKTMMFIAQTYVTLKRLIGGLVSPKNLMGPVGIITFSYNIVAHQPRIYYVYFLGLISAVIAVFNFLPLPPLDGGLVLLLFIEKIKGSAISERTQAIIAYTGWALILALLVYVTFNDIGRIRNLFG